MHRNRTHCRKGHALTPDNIYSPKTDSSARWCLTCKRNAMKAFRGRNPLYAIWQWMIRRCTDPTCDDWHLYGGRVGNPVTVCERWYKYQNFVEDMPPRPSLQHTIDRIDGTKGYEPRNVKWSTAKEQARNTARNIFFEHDGLRLTLGEWAEKSGMKYLTLYTRIFTAKMPFSEALTTPVGMPTQLKGRVNKASIIITHDGKTMAMIDWAAHLGINYGTLKSRVDRWGDPIRALTEPFHSYRSHPRRNWH